MSDEIPVRLAPAEMLIGGEGLDSVIDLMGGKDRCIVYEIDANLYRVVSK